MSKPLNYDRTRVRLSAIQIAVERNERQEDAERTRAKKARRQARRDKRTLRETIDNTSDDYSRGKAFP